MNIIIWYAGFEEAGVEFVAHVAKDWRISESIEEHSDLDACIS